MLPRLSLHALRSLGRAIRARAVLAGGALAPALREQIILHVSSVNSCAVCSSAHGEAGARVGLSDDEIRASRGSDLDRFDPRTRAALRYAELRTWDQEDDAPDDVAALDRHFSAAEIAEIRAVVDLFTFNNRFNNTWEGILPGAKRRRRRLGIP